MQINSTTVANIISSIILKSGNTWINDGGIDLFVLSEMPPGCIASSLNTGGEETGPSSLPTCYFVSFIIYIMLITIASTSHSKKQAGIVGVEKLYPMNSSFESFLPKIKDLKLE